MISRSCPLKGRNIQDTSISECKEGLDTNFWTWKKVVFIYMNESLLLLALNICLYLI